MPSRARNKHARTRGRGFVLVRDARCDAARASNSYQGTGQRMPTRNLKQGRDRDWHSDGHTRRKRKEAEEGEELEEE
jgi:hypothetical protein